VTVIDVENENAFGGIGNRLGGISVLM